MTRNRDLYPDTPTPQQVYRNGADEYTLCLTEAMKLASRLSEHSGCPESLRIKWNNRAEAIKNILEGTNA